MGLGVNYARVIFEGRDSTLSMSVKHHIEQEIKLTAPDASTLNNILTSPLLTRALEPAYMVDEPLRLHARYYDTHDWALFKLGWSLRTRFEGDAHICALKRNHSIIGGHSRCEEIEQPVATAFNSVADIPSGTIATAILSALSPKTQLLTRVKVNMLRSKRLLRVDQTLLELASDSGEILANGRAVHLDELELELIEGDIQNAASIAFVDQLIDQFKLRPSKYSKHQIGLMQYDLIGH